jgi:voltage-gated potassium channel
MKSQQIIATVRRTQSRFSDWYFSHRHSVMFLSLLLTLILGPVTEEYHLRSGPLELLYLMNLTAAAVGLDSSRARGWAVVIVTLTAACRLAGRLWNLEAASELSTTLFVGMAILAAGASLRFALKAERVGREQVAAALSAYLLAGHVFGVSYWQVEQLRAGSFAASGVALAAGTLDLPTCVYFSFVTLATLGYGDIVPLTPTVRGLAVGEAIFGQLYLAVLVARLIGARITK